jgi:hypothetical protein
MNELSELQKLEEEFARLSEEDSKTPGKHALELNALGEEIALANKELSASNSNASPS